MYKSIAQRIVNAENNFLNAVSEQFGFSPEEALTILNVFKKYKIIKIDAIGGQFTLSHGAYWDKEVMNNALAQKIN